MHCWQIPRPATESPELLPEDKRIQKTTPLTEAMKKNPGKKSQSWAPNKPSSNLLSFINTKKNVKDQIYIFKNLRR